MKITIISHNYSPEDSGIGLYSTGMAEYLAKNNEVNVITGFPYYPQWKIQSDYVKKSSFYKEKINNVIVYRFKQYTPANPGFITRILQMVHFFLGSFFNIFKVQKNDVIIVILPFTISAALGLILRKLKGGKLYIHIQDFEFDAAFKTAKSEHSNVFSKLIFKTERFLLNKADYVSTISEGMLEKLSLKTNSSQIYFPNWIDFSLIDPEAAKSSPLFDPDNFNILYSGNIGEKQDWDFYIKFVKSFEWDLKIQFYLIGDGAKRSYVVDALQGQQNFCYHPPVKYEVLNDVLCNADLHVLFQKPDFKDLVMPSKILGMMASSKPSIVTGHSGSEIKTNFENSGGGYYFDENNIENIKEKVIYLKENPKFAKLMGLNARKFVITHFAYEKVMSKFQKTLQDNLILKQ